MTYQVTRLMSHLKRLMVLNSYVRLFNIRRCEVVTPGAAVTVDESGSAWRDGLHGLGFIIFTIQLTTTFSGKNANFHVKGMPHVTKAKRKPEPYALEFKVTSDYDV